MAKLAIFSKFQTHDLEELSPNYEKAHLLSIDNIAAKFEEATLCSLVTEIFSNLNNNPKTLSNKN